VPENPDVVVASIQNLHAIVRGNDQDARQSDLTAMVTRVGVVLVDEAHRLLAPSYTEVLRFLGIEVTRNQKSRLPLIGLTATPYRGVEDETRRLAARFHGQLLRPTGLGDDPVATLRQRHVLSRPKHVVVAYVGQTFSIETDATYRNYFDRFSDFHPELLARIGEAETRNRVLRQYILRRIPDAWPTLFFGCSVEHATAMAVLLRRQGRSAETVTGATRPATRRFLIEEFRSGRLSVLCNYGVLTTGFDAPQVRAVVVARPTASAVLYEQMIGRGMRGPAFGGTPECLVVDVEDNIQFGGQMAFRRYEQYWQARPARPPRDTGTTAGGQR
jgi:superfamily II DNA or RNA helicase